MDDSVLFPIIITLIVAYLLVAIVGAIVTIWRNLKCARRKY
jgi:hypothetical protein